MMSAIFWDIFTPSPSSHTQPIRTIVYYMLLVNSPSPCERHISNSPKVERQRRVCLTNLGQGTRTITTGCPNFGVNLKRLFFIKGRHMEDIQCLPNYLGSFGFILPGTLLL